MRTALVVLALAAALAVWPFLALVWSPSSADEGCGLDPSGRCGPAPQTDAGCGLDPSGRCETDAGLGFDPSG